MKKIEYSPLYFLMSLGAGGMSVMFFMYLMFMTKHPNTPVPTFDSIMTQFNMLETSVLIKSIIVVALIGIIIFAFIHFKTLFWNITKFLEFKKTKKYEKLKTTNSEVQLMAFPLTLAMTLNVLFIIGAVFVPNLWEYVEYLFPFALVGFTLIGIFALKIFSEYFTRLLTKKSFDFDKNNNLSQMLSMFTFSMIGVGFAASAAMSHNHITAVIGLLGSIFFITLVIFFGLIKIILGFKSILENGIDEEASPTFWVIIPILTLIGITFVRQSHGLEHNLDITVKTGTYLVFITMFLSLQIIFGYLGYKIMKANKYFEKYIHGDKLSPGSFALICPGVALVVFGFFFVHLGLVKNGVIEKFGIMYGILILLLIYLQFITIKIFFKLKNKLK